MENLKKEIEQLKQEKNAVLLAHYYVDDAVQEIADYVGDSYYLAKVALKESKDVICFAGVNFMGESAKILNPDRTVIMPDQKADCPMAHMVDVEKIEEMRKKYDDLAVVCYINSTAEIKAHSDVCVTSSNAVKIVKALPNKNIFFIPDRNLAHYIAGLVPEKNFIYNEGFCIVHEYMEVEEIQEAKAAHPEAEVLSHPECPAKVLNFLILSEVLQKLSRRQENQMRKNLSSVQKVVFCMNFRREILRRNFTLQRQLRSSEI